MTKVYIKFLHASDVYTIYPNYDLWSLVLPSEYQLSKVCSRCGENLYLPIEVEEGLEIYQPLGDIFRPLPKEAPNLVIGSEPDRPILTLRRDKTTTKRQPGNFQGVTFIGDSTFEMVIDDFSESPVNHVCEDKRGAKC